MQLEPSRNFNIVEGNALRKRNLAMATARAFGWGFHVQFSHDEVVEIVGIIKAAQSIEEAAQTIAGFIPTPQASIVGFVASLAAFVAKIYEDLLTNVDKGDGVFVSMLWFVPFAFLPTTVVKVGPPPATATVEGMGPVMPIGSVQFPNVFLRMDGNGVTAPVGPGAGTVNCQFGAGPYEKFRFVDQGDGMVAIVSVQFPNVCLRMDGNGVTAFAGAGAGMVNCQFGAGPWEKFRLIDQGKGIFSIESVQFPGVVLRMDGHSVTAFAGAGAGTVNCQFGAGPYEKFRIGQM